MEITHIHTHTHTHTHKGGLKSSYDVISTVGDFFTNGIQALQHGYKKVCEPLVGLLKNKPHLVIFHESILVSQPSNTT